MKRFLSSLFIAVCCCFAANAREVVNMNPGWLFYPEADTTRTPVNICLPHDYQIHQPWVAPAADEKADLNNGVANIKSRLSARGFKEPLKGLYRKTLYAPKEWQGKRVVIDFEGILLTGEAFLNGEKIGATDYGYLGFEADISDRLRYGDDNIIEVVADAGKPENSRWYTGAGLYRDVRLILSDKNLHFARHPFKITTPEVSSQSAKVALQAEIFSKISKKTPFAVKTVILSPSGEKILEAVKQIKTRHREEEYPLDTLTITSPQLWDCENPNLYTAVITLQTPDGQTVDSISQRFGIRTVEYSADHGFLLNGKKVYLKGIANHHTLGALGAAAHPDAIRKRLNMLKDWGFNHIRTSHNPYSESLLEMCDELGILVVDELYDKWLTQYAGGKRDWLEQWQTDLPEWVKRDRNHPSVILWSLGNELQTLWDIPYHDFGVTPYRMQRELLKRFDSTRPTTVAMHPRGRHPSTDSLPAPLAQETDIASYNYRFMYFPGDARRFPDKKFYLSEASTSRLSGSWFGPDRDKTIGLAYWGAIDYLGESQGWPAKGWDKGVFDISLNPKPQAWLVRSMFREDEPVVHIGIVESEDATVWNDVMIGTDSQVDHWNFRPGSNLKLYTYTNGDEVELRVNGRSLGRKPNPVHDFENRNAILWDSVAYTPGYAEAIAYRDGRPIATHRIETASAPVRLKATLDAASPRVPLCAAPETASPSSARGEAIKTDELPGGSLIHISISAVDKKGRVCPDANEPLTFELLDPKTRKPLPVDDPSTGWEIAGFINGDITSDAPTAPLYNSESANSTLQINHSKLYRGRSSLILRRLPSPIPSAPSASATPLLRISSPSLSPVTLKIR